jgi:hypothetical protein
MEEGDAKNEVNSNYPSTARQRKECSGPLANMVCLPYRGTRYHQKAALVVPVNVSSATF